MRYEEEAQVFAWSSILYLATMVILALGLILATATWLGALPWMLDAEREAAVHSHQFVASRQAALVEYSAAYRKLDVRIIEAEGNDRMVDALVLQRDTLIDNMKREAASLNPEDIPKDARTILENNQ